MLVNLEETSNSQEPKNNSSHQKNQNPGVSLDRVAVIILGGGEGRRLEPLTKTRCKPAISFGGRYSLIDIPISNSISSGLSKIFVVGQYLASTLQQHLFQTYLYHGGDQNKIQLLVPEERGEQKIWYKGTADAVRKNLGYFSEISADYFLILSGDQLYNINFQNMINYGVDIDASMLIAAQPVNKQDARRMGLLKVKSGCSELVSFCEKPQEDSLLESYYLEPSALNCLGYNVNNGRHYLGSMGIYLFKRRALFDLLQEDNREDFGKHLINTQLKKGSVHAFLYDGYWEDIGTIESYYKANLALTKPILDGKEGLQCYDEGFRIITKRYNLPGVQLSKCLVHNALICEGSIVECKEVTNSVLGIRSVVHQGSVIRDSIIMGNEYYKRSKKSDGLEGSYLDPGVGENCYIEKAIIDENVTIGNNVRLINQKEYDHFDSYDNLVLVRDGIIIVPKGTHIPDNYEF